MQELVADGQVQDRHGQGRAGDGAGVSADAAVSAETKLGSGSPAQWEGVIFGGALVALIGLLLIGNTPFRAVTLALVTVVLLAAFNERSRLGVSDFFRAFGRAAVDMVPLIAAVNNSPSMLFAVPG